MAQTPAPNVIYIMLDDLGPGEYSAYDNLQGLGQTSKIATPNINSLASNGMRFENAHSATSLCAPTRATIMAGAPTWQTNTRWGFGSSSLQNGQQSVGDLMQAAGYKTALLGKGHLGGQVYQVGSNSAVSNNNFSNMSNMDLDRPLRDGMKEHGYDYTMHLIAGIQARPYVFWEDDLATSIDADGVSTRITNANKTSMTRQWDANYDDGVTEISPGAGGWGVNDWKTRDVPQAMLNKAVDFMQTSVSNDPNQPFFVHYNSVAGHWPYVAPTDIEVDINGDGDKNDPGESYNIDGFTGAGIGTESMQMVSVSDAEVGVLKSYLEQTDDPRNPGHKLIENTMIIYTSDNGGIGPNYTNQFGAFDRDEWDVYGHDSTAGLSENKSSSREGGHRVPFIVQLPGQIEAGSVRTQQVSNIDLMGTLAGLTGQSLIDQGQGSHNLMPVLLGDRDDSDPIRKNLVVEDTGGASDGQISRKLYYEGQWKLSLGTNATNPNVFEVFDLANDPGETNNLVDSTDPGTQQMITDMRSRYLQERSASRMAPVFVGNQSTVAVSEVSAWGDVQVEGVLGGSGTISGDLDANLGAEIQIGGSLSTVEIPIQVSQDIRIDENDSPQENYNTGRIGVGIDSDLGLQRSLVEFDLAGANLQGESIVGATIDFRVGFSWGPAVSSSPTIELYTLTKTFNEAEATWDVASTGDSWQSAGGDFDDLVLLGTASGFDPNSVNSGDIISLSGANLTNDILNNLANGSYQLLLKYDDASEQSGEINAVWFDSLDRGSTPGVLNLEVISQNRQLDVNGNYTQREGSQLVLDLGDGASAGVDYDHLSIAGDMVLKGGELVIQLDAGFMPEVGDTFNLFDFASLAGDFDEISLPALDLGMLWDTSNLLTTGQIQVVVGLEGDFNEDGTVDAADYTVWRDGLGTIYDSTDYDKWVANYGNTLASTSVAGVAIPEPSAGFILLVSVFVFSFVHRNSRDNVKLHKLT